MNKKRLIVAWVAVLILGGCVSLHQEAVFVADQKYYWESEGNLGISISGKFNSSEQMMETLNLTKEIGAFKSKKWKLSDVIVSMDFNANGDVATWEVSGPKPLLLEYLENLEAQYKDKSLFYDFGYSFINFKPSECWDEKIEPLTKNQEARMSEFGSKVAKIGNGMSPEQVKSILGESDLDDKEIDIHIAGQDTIWTYKHPVIDCARFIVIFRDGRVELSSMVVKDVEGKKHYLTLDEFGR